MKILIFGAGAIGSALGGFLSKEHEVTLLGRRPHLEAIRKKGLRVSGIWGSHEFRKLSLVTEFEEIKKRKEDFDLILLTVKSYDTQASAKAIRQLIRPKTAVLPFQNGLGNLEILSNFLPQQQLLSGRVIFGVELPNPGSIKVTVMAEPIAVGEKNPSKPSARVKQIVEAFNRVKLPTEAHPNVPSLLWLKAIYNAALNPLASLMDCHYGKLTEFESTKEIMNQVIQEIYDVVQKTGVKLPIRTSAAYKKIFYSKLVPRTYHHHPSMLQDLQKGKRTEIDFINGAVVRMGAVLGVKTPVNERLHKLILHMESGQ